MASCSLPLTKLAKLLLDFRHPPSLFLEYLFRKHVVINSFSDPFEINKCLKKKKQPFATRNVFLRHLWTILLKCNLAMLLIIKPWRREHLLCLCCLILSPFLQLSSPSLEQSAPIATPWISSSQILFHFQNHWFNQLSPWPHLFSGSFQLACPNNSLVIILHPFWAIRPLTCFLPIPVLHSVISHLIWSEAVTSSCSVTPVGILSLSVVSSPSPAGLALHSPPCPSAVVIFWMLLDKVHEKEY